MNMQILDEIVFVGEIPDGPNQTACDRLRPRLLAKLDLPLHAVLVLNDELWIAAVEILLDEGVGCMRLMFLATGPEEQVTGRDV